MATDIEASCRLCGKCQTNKTDTLKPQGFLHRLIGTKLLMSTVLHPQTDGATEQANHSIGQS